MNGLVFQRAKHSVDITGRKYGHLTALRFIGLDNTRCEIWEFLCDCGDKYTALKSRLRGGGITKCDSCRPSGGRKMSPPDAEIRSTIKVGDRFGKLVVSGYCGKDRHRRHMWSCDCDCGGGCVTSTQILTRGDCSSCGCIRRSNVKSGDKFQQLTVLGEIPRSDNKRLFVCRCDCGTEKVLTSGDLRKSKSCGCAKKTKITDAQAAMLNQYSMYKHSACRKNREFCLTQEQFSCITQSPCHYCGRKDRKRAVKRGYAEMNGIDRVDNGIGYTPENSRPCCSVCNYAKRNMSEKEFISWVKDIYEHTYKGE